MKTIYESIEFLQQKHVDDIDKALILMVPLQNVVKNQDEIPKKRERIEKLQQLIQQSLKIGKDEYVIKTTKNNITTDGNYE